MNQPLLTKLALPDFISKNELTQMIEHARCEDLGPKRLDITSLCMVPKEATTAATMRSRQQGVLCGQALIGPIVQAYDPTLKINISTHDGELLKANQPILTLEGSLRSILAVERIALNFMTHLSGIATLTKQYVDAVVGTNAKIYDTRKTIVGLRHLSKYAVVCGGGCNHRIGLHDAILIKDNHLAHIPLKELSTALREAFSKARAMTPTPTFIEVEVDTLDQFERVLPCEPDVILLDNMPLVEMIQAVSIRNIKKATTALEASGNVNLSNIAAVAKTGVDRIAIGAITHSAVALDIGLDIDLDRAI